MKIDVTVKRSGKIPKFDLEKAIATVKAFVPGAILARTDKGIDATGKAFTGYSAEYYAKLSGAGEDTKVDLRLTGGMLNSIKARKVTKSGGGAEIVFAPGTGGSPEMAFVSQSTKTAKDKKFQHLSPSERADKKYKLVKTGGRGPPQNVVAYWIHNGTDDMPPRPFLALTAKEVKYLQDLFIKVGLWK